jgi:hypothetical protein
MESGFSGSCFTVFLRPFGGGAESSADPPAKVSDRFSSKKGGDGCGRLPQNPHPQ